MSYTSIYATVRHDTSLISSALDLEDTWMEAVHAWVSVVKSGGLRGGSFFFAKLSLVHFPTDILKAPHAPTKMEFMWQGKIFLSHISSSTQTSLDFTETSVFHLGRYHWAVVH